MIRISFICKTFKSWKYQLKRLMQTISLLSQVNFTAMSLLLLKGDCVMNQWSEWSQCGCTEDSTVSPTRVRTRNIVTEPLPSAVQCEELEETEECPCYTYHRELLNWTNCEMVNEDICGAGT